MPALAAEGTRLIPREWFLKQALADLGDRFRRDRLEWRLLWCIQLDDHSPVCHPEERRAVRAQRTCRGLCHLRFSTFESISLRMHYDRHGSVSPGEPPHDDTRSEGYSISAFALLLCLQQACQRAAIGTHNIDRAAARGIKNDGNPADYAGSAAGNNTIASAGRDAGRHGAALVEVLQAGKRAHSIGQQLRFKNRGRKISAAGRACKVESIVAADGGGRGNRPAAS